jgi:hypothetical protein
MTLDQVKEAYGYNPEDEYHYFSGYNGLLGLIGDILLQVDDHDYQGDSRLIYQRAGDYGLLIFGWGSCSGCDALQACDTIEEVHQLGERLENSVQWMPAKELLEYFNKHDWEGDYSYHDEETKEFVEKAKVLLEGIVAKESNGQA